MSWFVGELSSNPVSHGSSFADTVDVSWGLYVLLLADRGSTLVFAVAAPVD